MSTVTMLLAWKSGNRWLFWLQMPFYVLLVFATVYIRAHYAIDSVAGLVVAFVLFGLFSALWPDMQRVLRLKK
jgi:membrane-associated phospholipid phosphatase